MITNIFFKKPIVTNNLLLLANDQENLQVNNGDKSNENDVNNWDYLINPAQYSSLLLQAPVLGLLQATLSSFDSKLFLFPFPYIAFIKTIYGCNPSYISSLISDYISDGLFQNASSQANSMQMQKLYNLLNITNKYLYEYDPKAISKDLTQYAIRHKISTKKFHADGTDSMLSMLGGMHDQESIDHLYDNIINRQIVSAYLNPAILGMKFILSQGYRKGIENHENSFVNMYLGLRNPQGNYSYKTNLLSHNVSYSIALQITRLVNYICSINNKNKSNRFFHILVLKNTDIIDLLCYKIRSTITNNTFQFFLSQRGVEKENKFFTNSYYKSTLEKISQLQIPTKLPDVFMNMKTFLHKMFQSFVRDFDKQSQNNNYYGQVVNFNIVDISRATRMNLNDYQSIIFTGNLLNMKYSNLNLYKDPILIAYADSLVSLDSAVESRFKYKIMDNNHDEYVGKKHGIMCYILNNLSYYGNRQIITNSAKYKKLSYFELLENFATLLANKGYEYNKCTDIIDHLFKLSVKLNRVFTIEELKNII